jgi:hypothetical protein
MSEYRTGLKTTEKAIIHKRDRLNLDQRKTRSSTKIVTDQYNSHQQQRIAGNSISPVKYLDTYKYKSNYTNNSSTSPSKNKQKLKTSYNNDNLNEANGGNNIRKISLERKNKIYPQSLNTYMEVSVFNKLGQSLMTPDLKLAGGQLKGPIASYKGKINGGERKDIKQDLIKDEFGKHDIGKSLLRDNNLNNNITNNNHNSNSPNNLVKKKKDKIQMDIFNSPLNSQRQLSNSNNLSKEANPVSIGELYNASDFCNDELTVKQNLEAWEIFMDLELVSNLYINQLNTNTKFLSM